MLVPNGGVEWEDMILHTSREEAIAKSLKWPNTTVQVFAKMEDGYHPSYKYYLNGILYPLSETLVSKDEKSSNAFSNISSSSEKLKLDGQ